MTGKAGRPPGYDWDSVSHMLGYETDVNIASHLGCDPSTVYYHRKQLGIPRSFRYDELILEHLEAHPMMSYSDTCKILGVDPYTIRSALLRAGERGKMIRERPDIDWASASKSFGEWPDNKLAEQLGTREAVVRLQRQRRGIDSFWRRKNG